MNICIWYAYHGTEPDKAFNKKSCKKKDEKRVSKYTVGFYL